MNEPMHQSGDGAGHDGREFTPYPDNGICAKLGDKWTVLVIWQLSRAEGRRLRFSELKKRLDGVTQRMLTLALRNLERDGLVLRHYFPEVPPRVEYELTGMGGGIIKALESVNLWVRENLAEVERSRRAYDERAYDERR